MLTTNDVDIHVRREIATSAQRIYTAFVAPSVIAKWFGPSGWTVTEGSVLVEPRVYGRYRLTLVSDEDATLRHSLRARILELVPGRRLVVEERTALTEMSMDVRITPTGESRCMVEVAQGPYVVDCATMATVGWESALVKLDAMVRDDIGGLGW